MKRKHLRILNQVGEGHGIFKYGIPQNTQDESEEEDNDLEKDYRFQRETFKECHRVFHQQIVRRHERRDESLHIAHYDYIIIYSFKILNQKQLSEWGLSLVSRTDWGLTMTAQITNEDRFNRFMGSILEYAQDNTIIHEVPVRFVPLTYINKFYLLSSDRIIRVQENHVNTTIQLTRLDTREKREIFINLSNLVGRENVRTISEDLQLYEVDFGTLDRMKYAVDNLDIIQRIQSVSNWHVSPSRFKVVDFNRALDIDMTNIGALPVVGLIDTGVRDVPAINNLIVERVKLDNNWDVRCGHGTNVASLILFGRQRLDGHLVPQARIFSIQVMENDCGRVSVNALKQKIIEGIQRYHIKVFNISLSDSVCKAINEGYSDYAKVLDEIAYLYDVLFVTATGNIEWDPNEYTPFPLSHYDPNDPYLTQMTNIGSPAENINGITVGAVGTVTADLPAIYTRKSHLDYTVPINGAYAEMCMINLNLMKPDVLSEGGDDTTEDNMIDVIEGSNLEFIKKSVGTSLAAPLITNLCARIIRNYPSLSAAAIKSLVINSAVPTGLSRHPGISQISTARNTVIAGNTRIKRYHLMTPRKLCRMIEGHGAVTDNDIDAVVSDDNIVTFVGEEQIKNDEIRCVNLKLPEQLAVEGTMRSKKLNVSITLCFTTQTLSGYDIVNYNPYHVSFRILKGNEDINKVAKSASYNRREDPIIKQAKRNSMHIKCALDSWSDDPLPSYQKKLFSNTQHKRFLLNYPDIVRTDNKITLAFRCVTRPNYNDVPISFSYSIKLELADETLKNGDFCLYEELNAINHLEVIDEAIANIEANI